MNILDFLVIFILSGLLYYLIDIFYFISLKFRGYIDKDKTYFEYRKEKDKRGF